DADRVDEAAAEFVIAHDLCNRSGPLLAVLGEQFLLTLEQRLSSGIVLRAARELTLHADELGPLATPLFVGPVGVDQARRVVVRVFEDGVEKCLIVHGDHPTTCTVPVAPSMRRRCPVLMRRCTSAMPATAGKPNSRATMAPCESMPPVSMTRPRACTN